MCAPSSSTTQNPRESILGCYMLHDITKIPRMKYNSETNAIYNEEKGIENFIRSIFHDFFFFVFPADFSLYKTYNHIYT